MNRDKRGLQKHSYSLKIAFPDSIHIEGNESR